MGGQIEYKFQDPTGQIDYKFQDPTERGGVWDPTPLGREKLTLKNYSHKVKAPLEEGCCGWVGPQV